MREFVQTVVSFGLAACFLFPSPATAEAGDLALVKQVFDGNSMLLASGLRIKYAGIRTPSLDSPGGREAREFSRRMVEGRKVRLEPAAKLLDKDGQALFYVFLENGVFVNAEMVGEGLAQAHIVPPNVKYRELLVRLEALAKKHRRGIWGSAFMPPPPPPPLRRGLPPGVEIFRR